MQSFSQIHSVRARWRNACARKRSAAAQFGERAADEAWRPVLPVCPWEGNGGGRHAPEQNSSRLGALSRRVQLQYDGRAANSCNTRFFISPSATRLQHLPFPGCTCMPAQPGSHPGTDPGPHHNGGSTIKLMGKFVGSVGTWSVWGGKPPPGPVVLPRLPEQLISWIHTRADLAACTRRVPARLLCRRFLVSLTLP